MLISSRLPGHPDPIYFTALKISFAFNEIWAFYAFWPQSWSGGQTEALAYERAEPQTKVARWVVLTTVCWVPYSVVPGALGISLCVFVQGLLTWRCMMKRIFSPHVFWDLLMQNPSPIFMLQPGEQVVGICLLHCKQNQTIQEQSLTWASVP